MKSLPKDIFNYMADIEEMRGRDLISFCSTDQKANARCDDKFYQEKIKEEPEDYRDAYNKYINAGFSPKESYIRLFSRNLRFVSHTEIHNTDSFYNEGPSFSGVIRTGDGNSVFVDTVKVKGTFNHSVSVDSAGKIYIDMGINYPVVTEETKKTTLLSMEAAFSSTTMEYVILLRYPIGNTYLVYNIVSKEFDWADEILTNKIRYAEKIGLTVDKGLVYVHYLGEERGDKVFLTAIVSEIKPWNLKNVTDYYWNIDSETSKLVYHKGKSAVIKFSRSEILEINIKTVKRIPFVGRDIIIKCFSSELIS